ncbi:MAG: LysR family transcriptional regulator [Silicimonas sp.]|jgi:DNA-binding transcriptional LysR family regulator|nr:LysR family transcriptional regulator [Silicimonas sp.]
MTKNAQIRWDDLDCVLAVVDHGSVAAAARALGVNHATVLRHIADFEARSGLRMFDKTTRGYRISPDRRAVVEAMREATEALGHVERLVESARPSTAGILRLTTTDTLAQYVLPPMLAEYQHDTGSAIGILAENAHLDLARMEAQVTVRPALTLPPEIDGAKVAYLRFGVYAAEGTDGEKWLGLAGPLGRTSAAAWMRDRRYTSVAQAESFLVLAAMAAAGMGKVVLPNFVGDATPGLRPIDPAPDIAPVPIWVGAHVDFSRSGRIRRIRGHLEARLATHPAFVPI